MRRVILAVTATVAGLVALLSFKTHSSSERSVASPSAPPSLLPGERAVTGNVADTVYGPVQVQVVVIKTDRIVKVNILKQPSTTQMDLEIGEYALPRLIGETITAQSARIDTVSGATYTSGGYIQSLQSALDNGG